MSSRTKAKVLFTFRLTMKRQGQEPFVVQAS